MKEIGIVSVFFVRGGQEESTLAGSEPPQPVFLELYIVIETINCHHRVLAERFIS